MSHDPNPLPPLSTPSPTLIPSVRMATGWGIRDPQRFWALLDEASKLVDPGVFIGDNMFVWMRNVSALDDAAFVASWRANATNPADHAVMWRRHVLCTIAYHAIQLDGAFVECGTLFGTGVKTVIDYFGRDRFNRRFVAYDTFDSNPVAGHEFDGQKAGLFEQVQARFAGYDQVHLVRGLLPASLEGTAPDQISWLHLDLNSADFELAVLDRLFDRLVPGGFLILDDYEWSGVYREQKIREDAWFEARQYRVIPLPTGQGLIVKR